ncbi:hypothetical protein CC78DRAFT_207433 [Lojkania enalia]|uniref:Mid2 domain-containing protein n=1 Tax=Lojkania enalia TaxID=147567 RepID=A0A9P4KFI5_9PLEO|nr:hypothetical protein CC78DRAFT_207433 [Didymosphaeria enalia]
MAFLLPRHNAREDDDEDDREDVDGDDSPLISLPIAASSEKTKMPSWWEQSWRSKLEHLTAGPPETFSTVTTPVNSNPTASATDSPVDSGPGAIIATSSRISSDAEALPTPTNTVGNGAFSDKKLKNHSHGGLHVAAGVVPVVVLAILGLVLFFYLRKRKRQSQKSASTSAEMKERNHLSVQPLYAASPPQPTPYSAPSSNSPPPPPSLGAPPPVILGPIVPDSSGAYLTGIDTSDVVSMNDRTGLGNPFADPEVPEEEPPPPYRPRSVAALSRDTSLRVPPVAAASQEQTNMMERREPATRSPFDDPDDDTVSDMSGPTGQRNENEMSTVSDISYQEGLLTSRRLV